MNTKQSIAKTDCYIEFDRRRTLPHPSHGLVREALSYCCPPVSPRDRMWKQFLRDGKGPCEETFEYRQEAALHRIAQIREQDHFGAMIKNALGDSVEALRLWIEFIGETSESSRQRLRARWKALPGNDARHTWVALVVEVYDSAGHSIVARLISKYREEVARLLEDPPPVAEQLERIRKAQKRTEDMAALAQKLGYEVVVR